MPTQTFDSTSTKHLLDQRIGAILESALTALDQLQARNRAVSHFEALLRVEMAPSA